MKVVESIPVIDMMRTEISEIESDIEKTEWHIDKTRSLLRSLEFSLQTLQTRRQGFINSIKERERINNEHS